MWQSFKVVSAYAPLWLVTLQWFLTPNRISSSLIPMASKALGNLVPASLWPSLTPLDYCASTHCPLQPIVINAPSSTLFAFVRRQRRTAGRIDNLHSSTGMTYTFSSLTSWCDHHPSGCSFGPLPTLALQWTLSLPDALQWTLSLLVFLFISGFLFSAFICLAFGLLTEI